MAMENDNEKRVPLSPDDSEGNIRLSTEMRRPSQMGNVERLLVATLAGLIVMLIISLIFSSSHIPPLYLWLPVAVFVIWLYFFIVSTQVNISLFISGSVSSLVAYLYSLDLSLFIYWSNKNILKIYLYALVFTMFGLIFSLIFKGKAENWQIVVVVFLLTFIVNSFI